jgi:DNA-binding NarL/FixJ family response regulator
MPSPRNSPPHPRKRPSAGERTDEPLTNPLTRRELEVAGLVARGLSNRQIASELHLSQRTVENHIAKILRKLALASRAQIAAWAIEQRLLVKPNTD